MGGRTLELVGVVTRYGYVLSVLFDCSTRRITPVPEEQRTDKRLYQFFFVWFSANANIFT